MTNAPSAISNISQPPEMNSTNKVQEQKEQHQLPARCQCGQLAPCQLVVNFINELERRQSIRSLGASTKESREQTLETNVGRGEERVRTRSGEKDRPTVRIGIVGREGSSIKMKIS